MKLYENIVIGNFLFALGFSIRAKQIRKSFGATINLLQQTPSDKILSDVLLDFGGTVRLIEFKTSDNRSTKEKGRHRALQAGMVGTGLEAISREVHWFIETAPTENTLVARIVPYVDAFPRGTRDQKLEPFIDALATEIVTPAALFTAPEVKTYLDWVTATLGGGVVGTGGLLFCARADGSFFYATLFDLLELRLEHRQWVAHCRDRHEREMKHQLAKENKKELERSRKPAVRER